ncbi:uncharacterized protein [Rutidosis leptorrhynchoides]|uniref:uncharacterized protein n=1 Tax=Rutidosis leptorrhynchoides TaxID=125765 RepID=UPI003A98D75B
MREVPSRMRDISPNSCNPQKVSIGPLHKQDKNVQEIENQKPLIRRDLLGKVDSPIEETIKACEKRVYARLDDIKACYEGLHNYTDADLAEMMVMDACFIVFLFLNDEEISHQEDKPYSLSAIYVLELIEHGRACSYKHPMIITSRSTGNSRHVPAAYSVRELVKAGLNSNTELVFFNLILYEQDLVIPPYFRSYVAAMVNLLETKEDHLNLVDLNIAGHDMKFAKNIPLDSQHVVDLIHNLSQGYDLYEFLYARDWYMMYNYCNGKLGWTRRTYFSNA